MISVPRSPLRLALWLLAALSAAGTLVLLLVTLALPGWLAGSGMTRATEALGRRVSLSHVRVQPWRLAVVVEGLRVAGPAGAPEPALLMVDRLDVALSLRSLLRGRLVVESVRLSQPTLHFARLSDGHYDVDDLVKRLAPGAADTPEPEFAVYNIEVDGGRVVFDDRPVQRRHELADLRLALPYLSTLAADVAVQVQPALSGRLDGVPFDSRAEALPFADTPRGRLSFKLSGLDLAPLAAYVPASSPVTLAAGRLDADLALDFEEPARGAPVLKLSGQVGLQDLALHQPGGQPLVRLQRLVLPLEPSEPLRRRLLLGRVQLTGAHAWLPESRRAASPIRPSAPEPAAAPWEVGWAGLALEGGALNLPGVELKEVQAQIGRGRWPLAEATAFELSLRLDEGRVGAKGQLSPKALEAEAELNALSLDRLTRWLPLPPGSGVAGVLSSRLALEVAEPWAEGPVDRLRLRVAEAELARLRVSQQGQLLLALERMRLAQATADTQRRELQFGALQLERPQLNLQREADGRLNVGAWLAAPGATGESAPEESDAWSVQAGRLALTGGAVQWQDAAVAPGQPAVALMMDELRLQAGPLRWPANADSPAVPLQWSARLAPLAAPGRGMTAAAGRVDWAGQIGLAPGSARGQLRAQGLPLHLLDGYLDPRWRLHLQRGELGLQADLSARRDEAGLWRLALDGRMNLGPLALLQTRGADGQREAAEDLLSWQSLQLEDLHLTMAPAEPLRLQVREAVLDDAYARLIVSEQGRFNLRDLGPAPSSPTAASVPSAAASAASAAEPAAAGVAPVAWAVGGVRVNRGLVDFNDRFVKPHYSARLSDLQGSLGSFASDSAAMAPLALRGTIAGTGQLSIEGLLRPGSPPAMDLQAQATDIELAPMSAYAARYAGYAIERGKLSARVRYQVEPGGLLTASNQLILNQLTFGERVESPDATALPVRFAVALLKDKQGVIDINLPVSGSLNDPEFSVGGLVWKLLLNLVGKALTSPFALLGGGGEGEQLQVTFAPGRAELTDATSVDTLARRLADRPGVQLTLTGWADAETEIPALRELHLEARLQAENAASPAQALERLYAATPLINKPRNALGGVRSLPPAQMRGLLMAADPVDDEALRQLALARAVAVRDALLARGLPNARVFLAAPKLCAGACGSTWRPHVELALGAP